MRETLSLLICRCRQDHRPSRFSVCLIVKFSFNVQHGDATLYGAAIEPPIVHVLIYIQTSLKGNSCNAGNLDPVRAGHTRQLGRLPVCGHGHHEHQPAATAKCRMAECHLLHRFRLRLRPLHDQELCGRLLRAGMWLHFTKASVNGDVCLRIFGIQALNQRCKNGCGLSFTVARVSISE